MTDAVVLRVRRINASGERRSVAHGGTTTNRTETQKERKT